ncbi:ATP-dependent DNA helicase II subunit 1 [Cymbomonas tetramitiformis]|uniref:ATP-dependent DNA helicase II subunit 1 n=1 Tax=Cymbomonas tetramitiformis TaxID=36881 RepID=A0AAE0LHF5_9CHLO|nr:ATP-dependent DNA helicase II subunit 1 [Cymbomonas tetramitiformis]|eukprot:gene23043-27888_t
MSEWYDEEEDDAEEKEYDKNKSFDVFLIDLNLTMFHKAENDESSFEITTRVLLDFLRNKIISSGNDMVGICFFGSREKKGNLNFENVYVYQELDFPDAQRIKELETLLTKAGQEAFELQVGSGCEDHGKALVHGLWTASNVLHTATSSGVTKRVLLFTNEDNPCTSEVTVSSAISRAETMTEQQHSLEILPLASPSKPFDFKKFYTRLQPDVADVPVAEKLTALRTILRKKSHSKRRSKMLHLHIGETVRIAVGLYSLVQEARKGNTVNLEVDTLEPVQTEVAWICQDTAAVLTTVDHSFFPYGPGGKVVFNNQEIAQVKEMLPRGLTLVGFKPLCELKDYQQLRSSSFLYPEEQLKAGSTCAFIALHKQMIATERFAIVWAQTSQFMPRLAALVAQEEVVDDEGQLLPPGMNMIPLPFSEDIRCPEKSLFPVTPLPRASSEMVEEAKKVVSALHLQDFSCEDIDNPMLQKHYRMLELLAIDYDKDMPDVEDSTVPDYDGFEKAGGASVVNNWKSVTYGANHDQQLAEKAATVKKGGSKRPAEKSVDDLRDASDVDWVALAKEGKLAKLTVPKLKAYCSAHKLPASGKKDDLVARISEHLSSTES